MDDCGTHGLYQQSKADGQLQISILVRFDWKQCKKNNTWIGATHRLREYNNELSIYESAERMHTYE